MKVVDKISVAELKEMGKKMQEGLVKADVDIAKRILIVDMGMHADGEAYLLERGSKQRDLWGINLHPDDFDTDDFIEFDSMINMRPSHGNPSRDILDQKVRNKIKRLVDEVVHE